MNACLIAPEKTIKLASNDLIRQYLKKNDGSSSLSMSKEIFAGATAGLAQSFLSTPMDLLKINMQDAGRLAAMSKSTLEGNMSSRRVLIDLLKKHGFAGLFRGFGATGGRNIFFSVVYFPVFYKINDWSPKNIKESGSLSSSTWAFLSGCVAGGVGAAAATPWDVVKTRMQRLKLAKCDVPYNGILDAFVKIFKTEGPFALMKGAGIRTVVIAPLFGILQAVYYLGIGEYILNQKDD
ncbi:mitochondrial glutamate carrier 2 [Folsomia candida]|uniref:mitochondrial glutamate carrier 2 n=1 Tax=Folsomia candida TaxID=158441 RepID=UPI001605086E|nr:mitochondrial glutamate carrier 2 [Folsomia candida]